VRDKIPCSTRTRFSSKVPAVMSQVHDLILLHGREQAKKMVGPDESHLVDAAAAVMAAEDDAFGVMYSGFALTALPHRRLATDDAVWERSGARCSLLVEPGRLPDGMGKFRLYGVPYGSRARLILLYLQTQAILNQNPEVSLGRSMREWMRRMGLEPGGQTYKDVREQSRRLAACNVTFSWGNDGTRAVVAFEKSPIIRSGAFAVEGITADEANQLTLWEDRVKLSELFFRELRDHPVPIYEPAIRAMVDNSTAMDIYIWLSYRLHVLDRPITVRWTSLLDQFGAGYSRLRDFKRRFTDNLKLALACYPDAKVDVDAAGMRLHPSPSPVKAALKG